MWDGEADVVVVGASVAGLSTAVNAAELGASTILLESADEVGGTGRKAAAWAWIPNNHLMQEKGIPDSREDAMAYLARFARRGVVFCTGGFSHNDDLRDQYHSGLLVPGCSVPTNQGVLVEVSKRLGAPLIHMNAAFMSPIQYEWVLRDDPEIVGLFQTPGDSMIIVNRHGRRIGNEKTSYNDRPIPHLTFDVERAEYGNLLSFALWDERTNTTWAGAPYGYAPAADGDRSLVVEGDTLEALADALDARLESLGVLNRGIRLEAGFLAGLAEQIARFNAMAVAGVDEDFRRGDAAIDRFFHGERIDNPYPNPTMHPISGLYGVGNCVASATGQAYLSGGITFGPYITFGRPAARAVAAAPVNQAGRRAPARRNASQMRSAT